MGTSSGSGIADDTQKRSFLRDASSVLTGRVAVQIAGFLTGILVARALGVEGKGTMAALLLAPSLIITIAEFGVRNAAAYHIGRRTFPVERIVETTLATALVTGTVGALACLGWLFLTWEETYSPLVVALAVLIVPGAILHTYVGGIFLGLQRIPEFAISSWGPGVAKLFGTVLLVGALGHGLAGAVGAAAASVAVVAVVMLIKLGRIVPLKIRWHADIARQIASAGSSYAIVYFMMVMVYNANIFLLQMFGTIEELGIYSLGSNLAELLWQIPAVMSALVFARSAAAKDEAKFSRKVASLARLTLLVGIAAGLVAWALAPIVVPFIYGDAFTPSAEILVALLPGAVAMVVFKILRQDLSGRGKPWAAVWMILPMLAATVVASALLIPTYGAYGAALSMSSVYVIGTLGFIIVYARTTGIPLRDLVRYRRSDFTDLANALFKPLRKARRKRMPVFTTSRIPEQPTFRSVRPSLRQFFSNHDPDFSPAPGE